MLLLDLLVNQKKITEEESSEIQKKLSEDSENVVDVLLEKKNVDANDILEIRSTLYGLPVYKEEVARNKDLDKYLNDSQIRQFLAVPISLKDDVLSVGIVDPDKGDVLGGLQFLFGSNQQAYKVYLISYENYRKFLSSGSKVEKKEEKQDDVSNNAKVIEERSYINDDKKKETVEENVDLTELSGDLSGDVSRMSIPELFNQILRHAIDSGASDIHIEHAGTEVRTRIRLDGQLQNVLTLDVKIHPMLIARIKILSQMKLDEKRKPQDGRFSTKMDDHTVDYRVSTFPGYYGEKVVLRILDSYKGVRKIDELGFGEREMKEIREALGKPYGMILICGPTGSGKTTTLYSMLNEIDREHKNVVSLEDPIEYNVGSMNQSQIFPEIGYSFASGLRSILRQDPDVIMVGEIRDAETAQLAIQAALTGHLVFSTIHTNTAIGVINRLLDMGIEPYLIAPTLIATIGQRLTRKIADGCKEEVNMTDGLNKMIEEEFKDLPDDFKKILPLDKPLNEAKPSKENPTGMKGRMPVFEVLNFTEEIRNAVLKRASEEEIWKLARANGFMTMKEDAIIKSIKGIVPYAEVNEL